MPGQVELRVRVGDAQRMWPLLGSHDLVAGAHLALGDHAQVEPRTPVGHQQWGRWSSPIRIPTRKHVTRGWVTSNSAVPMR